MECARLPVSPSTPSTSSVSSTPETARPLLLLLPLHLLSLKTARMKTFMMTHFYLMNSEESPCRTVSKLICCVLWECLHVSQITAWGFLWQHRCHQHPVEHCVQDPCWSLCKHILREAQGEWYLHEIHPVLAFLLFYNFAFKELHCPTVHLCLS